MILLILIICGVLGVQVEAVGHRWGDPADQPIGGAPRTGGTETTKLPERSTRERSTFHPDGVNECDFGALVCMRALKTGLLCARTAYYSYDTFRNACEMDYVNCVIGHERWMVMHMGPCIVKAEWMVDYEGDDTYRDKEDFLNNYYVESEKGGL